MSNVIRGAFPGEDSDGSADGGGPEDPMLEARVEALEKRMERIESKLDRLEASAQSLNVAIVQLTANCATKSEMADLQRDIGKIREDGAYMRGRLENLPSTWQMITFMLGSQIAFAGILFTALKFGLK